MNIPLWVFVVSVCTALILGFYFGAWFVDVRRFK